MASKPNRRRKAVEPHLDHSRNYQREIHEALAKEREARELIFFDFTVPFFSAAAGSTEPVEIPIRVMTLMDMLTLIQSRSPFLCGGKVQAGDIAHFLWTLCAHWEPCDEAREAFIREISILQHGPFLKEIEEYVDRIFLDAPGGGSTGPAHVSFVASTVHALASKYGWSQAEIFATPLPRIYQYLRCIERENRGGKGMTSRLSGAARSAQLRHLNAIQHPDAKVCERRRTKWKHRQWDDFWAWEAQQACR